MRFRSDRAAGPVMIIALAVAASSMQLSMMAQILADAVQGFIA